jgi:hypothetical protein
LKIFGTNETVQVSTLSFLVSKKLFSLFALQLIEVRNSHEIRVSLKLYSMEISNTKEMTKAQL